MWSVLYCLTKLNWNSKSYFEKDRVKRSKNQIFYNQFYKNCWKEFYLKYKSGLLTPQSLFDETCSKFAKQAFQEKIFKENNKINNNCHTDYETSFQITQLTDSYIFYRFSKPKLKSEKSPLQWKETNRKISIKTVERYCI